MSSSAFDPDLTDVCNGHLLFGFYMIAKSRLPTIPPTLPAVYKNCGVRIVGDVSLDLYCKLFF